MLITGHAPATPLPTAPVAALYNFRLLEALRSDDPQQVQHFLDELAKSSSNGQPDVEQAGRLLGMAVRVASGKPHDPSSTVRWA